MSEPSLERFRAKIEQREYERAVHCDRLRNAGTLREYLILKYGDPREELQTMAHRGFEHMKAR